MMLYRRCPVVRQQSSYELS